MQSVTGDDQLYRLFFESSSDALYVMPTSEEGIAQPFIEVNQRACEMLGYTYDQLRSMTLRDVDPEISTESWLEARARLWQEGQDQFFRQHARSDGSRIPVEISMQLFQHEGRAYVLSVVRDISDQLAAEARLQVSRQELQVLVDTGLGFSALVSPDTTILRINSVGAERLGSTPEALRGQRIVDLSPPEIASRREQVAREVVRQRKTITLVDNRDGMWLENTVSPVVDETQAVSRFAIFSQDITVSYLTRRLETLFNRIDREVLDGVPVEPLISYACEFLAEAFASPLISFTENVGTALEKNICRGSWCGDETLHQVHPRLLDTALNASDKLVHIFRARDESDLLLVPAQTEAQPAAIALLTIELPMGFRALLTITSMYERAFDHSEISALLKHAAGRFRVAFGLVADRRELSLVRQALERAHSAVIITDDQGKIVWTNEAFSTQSGYAPGEIEYAHLLTAPATPLPESHDPTERLPDPVQLVIDSGSAWSGETSIRRRDGSEYIVLQSITPVFAADGHTLRNLIAIQEDVSRRKRDEAHIRYLAEHDSLTGLHNREYLQQALNNLLLTDRRGAASSIALLYLDIDHFKRVNDQLGHATGDALLKGFANRLRDVVREGDLVCRMGGDEFVLVLMDIRAPHEAEAVGLTLVQSLSVPIVCDGHELTAQTSIGISLSPTDGSTPEKLLQNADAAMYESKRQGRGRVCFFAGGCLSAIQGESEGQERR